MNVFEAVKQNVTTRQAAELYGIRVGRNGMAVCPFHNDKNPSMKVDKRFHCFACQADGDVIDFVSRLFGLPSKEAAMKIADDFGISYDSRQKPSIRPKIREPTPEQKYQQEENHCYKILSDYFHLLRKWEKQYAPQQSDEVWHPLFVERVSVSTVSVRMYCRPNRRFKSPCTWSMVKSPSWSAERREIST